MIEIDPEDGLPVDLEAAVREANAERARQEAEDRVEFAHLYEGDWITTAEALQTLIARGSTREEAAGSLLMWLQTNDGKAPHLRARAEQARRCFDGRRRCDSIISRDCIIHSWDWVEKVEFADWGGGSFVLVDRATQTDQCRSELHLIGVTFSKDDLMARLSPSAVQEAGQRQEAAVGADVPSTEGTTRSGDPGRPTLSRELYLQELQTRIAEGKITSMNGTAEIARELQSWIKAEHPTAPLPTTKTIENRIRGVVRTLKIPPK